MASNRHSPDRAVRIAIAVLAGLFLFLGCSCSIAKTKKIDLGYKIYIPNLSEASITVIQAKESEKPEYIDLDGSPRFLARVPGTDTVFALLSGGNTITKVNSSDDTVDEDFVFEVGAPDPQENRRMLFNTSGQKAYVLTSYEQAAVAVMKMSDLSFDRGFNLGSTSIDYMYFSSDGSRLLCTDPGLGKIYVINTATDERLADIVVPESFTLAQYDPSNGHFYMTDGGSQSGIKEYDPISNTFVNRLDNVASNIVRIIKSSDGKKLYALGNDNLVTIDIADNSIDETIDLDYSSPSDFQYLPDRSYLLIPSASSDLLMILDTVKFTTENTINTGGSPGEMIIIQ